MNRLVQIIAIVFCLASACAEEKDMAVISVRAMRRLTFEDRFSGHPLGAVPVTFFFRRVGPTNEALIVGFELSGTAQPDLDYARVPDGPEPVETGAIQTVTFAPGERLKDASFHVLLGDPQEPSEFIRVRILPPIPNGAMPIIAPQYRVGARGCATVWILDQDRCVRSVPRPDGRVTCLEFRPFVLPPAFFTTARCQSTGSRLHGWDGFHSVPD
jgi:hypothetical protein